MTSTAARGQVCGGNLADLWVEKTAAAGQYHRLGASVIRRICITPGMRQDLQLLCVCGGGGGLYKEATIYLFTQGRIAQRYAIAHR
jgi:hypothetical protein